ncbi:MAG: hypothetical protein QF441_00460 [Bacteriovoracaceae bacterium]|jgi:hypothetical protein|nr:hypothetical protein [Bacteriovoracaceae bacterium]|tara:strand:- start:388 stop:573 length:186 start_codon:yes stop_codon:yes gene_type:complete
MTIDSKLAHDFTNNALRIEILHKMLCEEIEKEQVFSQEYLKDLEDYLHKQLEYIKKFKSLI